MKNPNKSARKSIPIYISVTRSCDLCGEFMDFTKDNNKDNILCEKCREKVKNSKNKTKKEYPKTLYVKQTTNSTGSSRYFREIVKNRKEEESFRRIAAGMEPNFSNTITDKYTK